MSIYKINVPILINHISKQEKQNLSDFELILTDPNGSVLSSIPLVYIDEFNYQVTWTPNIIGKWKAKISSVFEDSVSYSFFDITDNINSSGFSNVVIQSEPRYLPRLYQNIISTNITPGTETTLFNFSGDGKIDFISINLKEEHFEIILEVDNVEVYRIDIEDLKNLHKLTHSEDFINADSSSEFKDYYNDPIDFLTNFKIKAKNVDNENRDIKAVLIRYREKA